MVTYAAATIKYNQITIRNADIINNVL